MNTPMHTVYHRIRCGQSWEEATRPSWVPLWQWRIEQEEGRSLRDILEEGAAMAYETGYSLRDFAREWGVPRHRLQYRAKKWGIRFPQHASFRQRQQAISAAAKGRANQTTDAVTRQERQLGIVELINRCGSTAQAARLIGVQHARASQWRRGKRPVPDRYWPVIKELLGKTSSDLIHRPKARSLPDSHPWKVST